ncbi:MAG: hypothetical protein J6T70_19230 [Bacteroidales bacterium]|nr:hypothetical protein [Bacteroidales bacterium]
MNTVFNFKRFWMHLQRDFILNTKQYVAPSGAMVVVLLFYLWSIFQHYPMIVTLFGLIMFGGAMMVLAQTSMISNSFQIKTICTDYLTNPASMFEKYLTKIVKHFVLPMIVYVIVFKIALSFQEVENFFAPVIITVVFLSGIFLFWGAVLRRFAMVVVILLITTVLLLLRYLSELFLDAINFMWLDPVRVYFQSGNFTGGGFTNGELTVLFAILASLFFVFNAVVSFFIYRNKELSIKQFNW